MSKSVLIGLSLILLTVFVGSCGSVEEKKMKFFNKGKALFEQGEYVKAGLEFKNVLQIDPEFARGYYMLGRVEMKTDSPKNAFKAFSKAVALDPELTAAQIELGRLLVAANEIAAARKKADLILSKTPDNTDALVLKAVCMLRSDDAEKGKAILKSIIRGNPGLDQPYLILANFYASQAELEAATEILKDLLAQGSKNAKARLILASISEQRKDFGTAQEQYLSLIKQAPDQAQFKILLARFYARSHQYKKAENAFKSLIEGHPETPSYRLELARFYGKNGQEDAKVAILKESIRDDPKWYPPYEMLALQFVRDQYYGEALGVVDQFMNRVKTGPPLIRAKFLKATIYFKQKNTAGALRLIQEILDENPRDVRAHALKGDIEAFRGDYTSAISEYRFVLNSQPENLSAALNLARSHQKNHEPLLAEQTYRRILDQNPSAIEARFALAEIYAAKGDLKPAEEMLVKMLDADPKNEKALSMLVNLKMHQGDLPGAQIYVDRLSKIQPDAANTTFKKGLLKMAERKPGAAKTLFEQTLAQNPDFAPALLQLVSIRLKQDGIESAIQRCLRQTEKRPDNYRYHVLLGRLYAVNKEYNKATLCFEKALKLNSDSQDALFGLARVEQSLGSIDNALAKYEMLRKNNPENVVFPTLLGMLYEEKGEPQNAAEMYKKALAKDPDLAVAGNNLAFYYLQNDPTKEGLDKAAQIIEPLLREHGDSLQIVDTAAWFYYRKGEFEKARDLLLEIVEEKRKVPVINYHLGMIYYSLGQREAARKHLTSALKSTSNFPGKNRAKEAIAELLKDG